MDARARVLHADFDRVAAVLRADGDGFRQRCRRALSAMACAALMIKLRTTG